MSYVAPAGNIANLNLDTGQYTAPAASAVSFDLAEGWQPAPDYRKPPMSATVSFIRVKALANRTPDPVAKQHGDAVPVDRTQYGHNNDAGKPRAPAQVISLVERIPVKDPARSGQPWNAPGVPATGRDTPNWHEVARHDIIEGQSWDIQPAKDNYVHQPDNIPAPHEVSGHHRAADTILNWQAPPEQPVEGYTGAPGDAADFNLDAIYQPPGAEVVDFNLQQETQVQDIAIPTRSVDASHHANPWARQPGVDGETIHPWNTGPRIGTEVESTHGTEPNVPDNPEPDEPQDKRTYIIVNSSSLIAVASGQPLEFQDLTIQLDVDSYTWSMSAAILNRASMDQIRPTADGPAEVLATINGHQWSFLVESYSADNRFARERYQIQGVSRTQLLAAPYAPRRTGWIASATNMQQIIAQQLEFTGFSTTLQSGLTDYVVPAGAWGYTEKTALQVIAELAGALGAVVVPDPTEDELHIRHRYKQTPPWLYDSLQASEIDAIIQDTMVISYASRWDPQPEYNGVFVSGITHGVAIQVNRNGTAGDLAAADVFDTLNVDTNQCRYRGMAILSASGPQEIVSIETILPTSGSPGLILPAQVVEYRDTRTPANTWRGNVLGVQIACSRPGTGRVKQTVHVERHHYPDGFGDIPTAAVLAGADLVMADDNLVIAS